MIATAKPWSPKPGCPTTAERTYFAASGGTRVIAEVTTDPYEGRIWFAAWRLTGRRDRWGNEARELITRGSYALVRGAAAVAKARVSRAASAAARQVATAYYQARLARAIERADAARALLDATDLTDYRTFAARQDELVQLVAELDHVKHMMALAA